jgi:ribonuclease-3
MTEFIEQDGVDQKAAAGWLASRLGYHFRDPWLLQTALTHRSIVHQLNDPPKTGYPDLDNQRLEFLGDAVLGLTVSTLLYKKFPGYKEGLLSRLRAGLVNEARLAQLARQVGVPEALRIGRGEEVSGGRDKDSILADALEAIVAAVYLDGGFPAAFRVVEGLLGPLMDREDHQELLKDFKTRLQEQTQRAYGLTPEYRLTDSWGPDHERTFQITLYLGDAPVAKGDGRSKKEAEQSAARAALNAREEDDFQLLENDESELDSADQA